MFDLLEMEDDARRDLLQVRRREGRQGGPPRQPLRCTLAGVHSLQLRPCTGASMLPCYFVLAYLRLGAAHPCPLCASSLACPQQMTEPQLEDVARWCNRYPDINVSHALADADDVRAGEPVSLTVALERELEGELRPVDAPRWVGGVHVAGWK